MAYEIRFGDFVREVSLKQNALSYNLLTPPLTERKIKIQNLSIRNLFSGWCVEEWSSKFMDLAIGIDWVNKNRENELIY